MLSYRLLRQLPLRQSGQIVRRIHAPRPAGPRSLVNKRPPPVSRRVEQRPPPQPAESQPSREVTVSSALHEASERHENTLQTPVNVPEDRHGVLRPDHPATSILTNSTIVIQRQLEMANLLVGFEQANKYVIMDPQGNHIGFLAEQEHGIGSTIKRQAFGTHRGFTAHVFDRHQQEVLRIQRPFSWINSKIRVYDPLGSGAELTPPEGAVDQGFGTPQISWQPLSSLRIIGEAQQQWAPLRRKYNLFLARPLGALGASEADPRAPQLTSGELPLSNSTALQVAEGDSREIGMAQFAYVNEPFLSWDFSLMSADSRLIGSVNRNFAGFAREIFTDTGVYALRMDSVGLQAEPSHLISQSGKNELATDTPGMTLDQRAIMLATAVSIDFDYFSRHSGAGGGVGFFPLWFPGSAPAAEAGGVAAGETGVAGAAETGLGSAARGATGMGEGAIAGAGTMAGYEAMQRARERQQEQVDDASPQAPGEFDQHSAYQQNPTSGANQNEEVWGEDFWGQERSSGNDPWGGNSGGGSSSGGSGGGGDGGDFWSDFF